MTDRFVSAVSDLRDALLAGEPVETALADVAADYELPVEALANRARRAYGDLSTLRARREAEVAETASRSNERREEIEARRAREAETVAEFFRTYDFRNNSFRS